MRRIALIATFPLRYFAFLTEQPEDDCAASLVLPEPYRQRTAA